MAHIHTGDNEHDFTVTGYIVRLDQDEPRVMLHMHKKLNALIPVGGHVELTETPWQAIGHELIEESGYELSQLEILQPRFRVESLSDKAVMHPYPAAMNTFSITENHFHTDIEYAFITREEARHKIGQGESTDTRWLTGCELNSLDEDELFPNTREIYNFILNDGLNEWIAVPTKEFKL